jgi:dGTPase
MCAPRRKRAEPIDDLGSGRGDFDRDYTAILYSHAFRRLRHKTQVFFYSQNDHVCTRLDHCLYVAAIAEVVCKNLQENGIECDPVLARTIGIGHDLGHAPFGHAGEKVLDELAREIGGFKHEKHGLRIVDKIEKPRDHTPIVGLNLTLAVRDGIVNHCGEDHSTRITPSDSANLDGGSYPFTVEGCIVRLVDKIAYLGRDLEDAIIAQLIDESDIPAEIGAIIGTKNGEIVDYFVGDIIRNSGETEIALSEQASGLMSKLMEFNYEKIYEHEKIESYKKRVNDVLRTMYERFLKTLCDYGDRIDLYIDDDLKVVQVFGKFIADRKNLYFTEEASRYSDGEKLCTRIVVDFLSTLTDNFVFQACSEYFLPRPII